MNALLIPVHFLSSRASGNDEPNIPSTWYFLGEGEERVHIHTYLQIVNVGGIYIGEDLHTPYTDR